MPFKQTKNCLSNWINYQLGYILKISNIAILARKKQIILNVVIA